MSFLVTDLVDITTPLLVRADQAVDGHGTGGTPDRTVRGADAEVLVRQEELLRRNAFSLCVDLDGLSRPWTVLEDGANSGSGALHGLEALVPRVGMHLGVTGPCGRGSSHGRAGGGEARADHRARDTCLARVTTRRGRLLDTWGPNGSGLVHRAAPGTGLDAPALDELLEPVEVGLGPFLNHVQEVADLLHQALGLVLQTQAHQGSFRARWLEVDRAGVRDTAGRRPRDLLVGNLLEDGGVPFTLDPRDLRDPVQQ